MDTEAARAALTEQRAEAVRRLQALGATFDDIVASAQDSNIDDEHDPEGTTIASERSMISSLERSTRQQVADVDAALRRLDDGTYGACLGCGEPIGDGRLEARPTATHCIKCASAGR